MIRNYKIISALPKIRPDIKGKVGYENTETTKGLQCFRKSRIWMLEMVQ